MALRLRSYDESIHFRGVQRFPRPLCNLDPRRLTSERYGERGVLLVVLFNGLQPIRSGLVRAR